MPHGAASSSFVVSQTSISSPRRLPAIVSGLLTFFFVATISAQTPARDWSAVSPASLCVTEGAVDKTTTGRLSVNVPKMRAYVNAWTGQLIEAHFTYLGRTKEEKALGSGEMRRQFGFKLRAQDPCNLVYAIWRIGSGLTPESKLVVSVKRNANQHTSAECGNRGYENIKPRKSSPVPHLRPGEPHTLRAEIKNEELRVFVDSREVWEGELGADAALSGRVGIRSDNARLEFDLRTGPYIGVHPNYLRACQTSDSD